jgi:two-component system NarL family sensor kinase
MPPHPLLADDVSAPLRPKSALLARGLFGYAALLFVGGILFVVLNGFPPEQSWGDTVTSYFFPLVPFAFSATGLTIAHRHGSNPIAWISLAIGIAGLGPIFPSGYAQYTLVTNPGALPFGPVSAWMEEWGWITWAACAGIFFLLMFPDGKLLSRRWKFAVWFGALASCMSFAAVAFKPGRLEFNPSAINPFGWEGAGLIFDFLSAGLILLPIAILVAATSLVFRFLRSEGDARLQLKWLIAASAAVLMSHIASTLSTVGYAVALGPPAIQPAASPSTIAIVQGVATLTWITIPISAGVAALSYRLQSIDRVIRNVIVALVLAAFAVTAYAVTVLGVSLIITSSTKPNLTSSLAAAAVVGLFFVLMKEHVEKLADRVVYGKPAEATDSADPMAGGRSIG